MGFRDPYGFVFDDPVNSWDSLGLEPSTKSDCETLKSSVRIRKPGDKDLKDILDYLDKAGCPFDVTCEACPCSIRGKGEAAGGGKGNTCMVTVCADRHDGFTDIGRSFLHEFIHCKQRCTGPYPPDCRSCLCRELEAYGKSGECSKYDAGSTDWYSCMQRAAGASCTGTTPTGDKYPCEGKDWKSYITRDFIDKCSTDGTPPPATPHPE
jgi:hypothetical protein